MFEWSIQNFQIGFNFSAGNWLSGAWKKARNSIKKVVTPEEQPGIPDEPQEDSTTEYHGSATEYGEDTSADDEDLDANAPADVPDADYEAFDGMCWAVGLVSLFSVCITTPQI